MVHGVLPENLHYFALTAAIVPYSSQSVNGIGAGVFGPLPIHNRSSPPIFNGEDYPFS